MRSIYFNRKELFAKGFSQPMVDALEETFFRTGGPEAPTETLIQTQTTVASLLAEASSSRNESRRLRRQIRELQSRLDETRKIPRQLIRRIEDLEARD